MLENQREGAVVIGTGDIRERVGFFFSFFFLFSSEVFFNKYLYLY